MNSEKPSIVHPTAERKSMFFCIHSGLILVSLLTPVMPARAAVRQHPSPEQYATSQITHALLATDPQHPRPEPASPQAIFPQLSYDAGTVEAGVEVTHTFEVKNAGLADLLITQVNPSCECTLADFTKVVPPGQVGHITLRTKTPIFGPNFATTAWVYSNDPTNPLVRLTLRGTIHQLVQLLPSPSLVIRTTRGETAQASLTLVNRDHSPLKILGVASTNPEFTTKLRTLREGQHYELTVKLKAKKADGQFTALLTVLTNKEKLAKIPIAVVATVVPRVQVWPEQLVLGRIPLSLTQLNEPGLGEFARHMTIKSQTPGFRVTKVETTLPFVQLELIAPAREGMPYNLKVALVKERLKEGPFRGMIIVYTNDRKLAEVKIPISGEVR